MGGRQMLIGSVEGHRDWDSGLFSCCTDCKSLILTYCCLPCALCNISSRVGECSCMPWFVPGALVALRTRIRTLGGIQELNWMILCISRGRCTKVLRRSRKILVN
ncbi:PLAC8-like protein 1 [Mercenaria mercenaria]|uniref:PLAC8-like protein 1 n=1 Tax=Mercenaria mercenaria TaxID=6596 RepID=UPI00234E63A0|nr:PLAC8-like protein 1 [Mercenaria mercenaria]